MMCRPYSIFRALQFPVLTLHMNCGKLINAGEYETAGFIFFWEVGRVREIITMACTECKRRNYTSTKNKRNITGRLELKKYCRFCNSHTVHRETK